MLDRPRRSRGLRWPPLCAGGCGHRAGGLARGQAAAGRPTATFRPRRTSSAGLPGPCLLGGIFTTTVTGATGTTCAAPRTISPPCPGRRPFPSTPRLPGFLVTPLNLRLSGARIRNGSNAHSATVGRQAPAGERVPWRRDPHEPIRVPDVTVRAGELDD